MYSRSFVGVDWVAISNDLFGLFMAVLGCGLVALAVGGCLFLVFFGVRMAINFFKDGNQ